MGAFYFPDASLSVDSNGQLTALLTPQLTLETPAGGTTSPSTVVSGAPAPAAPTSSLDWLVYLSAAVAVWAFFFPGKSHG